MTEVETRRPLVLGCILLALSIVAMEGTVVATAMPNIVGQLGGLSLYSWVTTAFLLTQAGTTVIFGKLADLYGRRPVLVGGLLIFLAGSVLCGLARSMESLIAFRLVQGLGAGSIMPVVITLVGDLYTARERARVQGWLSSVWALSAVLGPLLGGLIVQHWSWPWIFWINVPIALAAIAGLLLFLHERPERRGHVLDVGGAALFLAAIAALLAALTQAGAGGRGLVWVGVCGAIFLAAAPLFLWMERRVPEPMIDLALWARPLMRTANATLFAANMAFMGVTVFLPVYIQGVLGGAATEAGLAIGAISIGWPLASTLAGRIYGWIGVTAASRAAAVVLVLGCLGLLLVRPGEGLAMAAAACFFIGAGLGVLTNLTTILILGGVGWSERGAATSASAFARTMGGMLGVALLGGLLNGALHHFAGQESVGVAQVQDLLDGGGAAAADAAVLRAVLGCGLQAVFGGIVALALLTLIATWRLPTEAAEAELGRA